MVLRGEITNAAAIGGLLAAARARDADWRPLRDPETPLGALADCQEGPLVMRKPLTRGPSLLLSYWMRVRW